MYTGTTLAIAFPGFAQIVRAIFTAGANMKRIAMKCFSKSGMWIAVMLVLMAIATPASAQKNKDKKNTQPADNSRPEPNPMMPDSQAIDQTVGEALGYWQIGDLDSLHKYYSDDVVVVSGLWETPIIGWANYAKAYADQRARVSGQRMDRSNTLIKVNGNSAWATYQFIYLANVDGKVAQFRGHTTMVLNKQGDRWVIVLNHSSIVDATNPTAAAPTASAPPTQH
jgi:ketosteroid isomerase-like protein